MAALILTAQINDPPKKIELAIRMMLLRPKTSESFPQKGTLAALASRYAEPIHAYNESGIWKDRDIVGRAVGMSTVSSATRKILSVSAPKQSSVASEVVERGETSVAIVVVETLDGWTKPPSWCLFEVSGLRLVMAADSGPECVDVTSEVCCE